MEEGPRVGAAATAAAVAAAAEAAEAAEAGAEAAEAAEAVPGFLGPSAGRSRGRPTGRACTMRRLRIPTALWPGSAGTAPRTPSGIRRFSPDVSAVVRAAGQAANDEKVHSPLR